MNLLEKAVLVAHARAGTGAHWRRDNELLPEALRGLPRASVRDELPKEGSWGGSQEEWLEMDSLEPFRNLDLANPDCEEPCRGDWEDMDNDDEYIEEQELKMGSLDPYIGEYQL